jgi:hypothetical protein
MITSIKHKDSEKGLDDLFDYSADDVETAREIGVKGRSKVQCVIEELEEFIAKLERDNLMINDPTSILTPKELDVFVTVSEVFKDNVQYKHNFSHFLDVLIRNSYNEGNNNFYLDFTNLHFLHYLLHHFRAKEDNPLKMTVCGNFGSFIAKASTNVNLVLDGNCNFLFGQKSSNLTAYVTGNVGRSFGFKSDNMTAIIGGDYGDNFKYGFNNSTVYVNSNLEKSGFLKISKKTTPCDVKDDPLYQKLIQDFEGRIER